MNISQLELTVRSHRALAAAGISTVEQLVALDWKEVQAIRNAGDKSVSEIVWACVKLRSEYLLAECRHVDQIRSEIRDRLEWKAARYDAILALLEKR